MSNLRLLALLAVPFLTVTLAATRPAASADDKPAPALSGRFTVDGVHSTVQFQCMHLGTSWAFGRFDTISGNVNFDPAKPESSSVEITIDTRSVNTAAPKRDDHLKSGDFLDTAQFPTATFKSTKVAKKGGTTYTVTGDLMLHGVTKSVTFDMDHTGGIDHPKMGKKVGFLGHLSIQRSAYGITTMTDALGDEVKLTFSVEAGKE